MATLCKRFATARVLAREGSVATVDALVSDEIATMCKRLATAAVLAHETLHASARRWSRHRLCAALGGRHVKAAPTLTQLRHRATLQLDNGNANFFAVDARQFVGASAAATFFASIASLRACCCLRRSAPRSISRPHAGLYAGKGCSEWARRGLNAHGKDVTMRVFSSRV